MAMQISSTIPANNLHMLQTRRSSFKCRQSSLNPSTVKSSLNDSQSSSSTLHYSGKRVTNLTRLHLSNLDNLLQKSPNPVYPEKEEEEKKANKVSDNASVEERRKDLLERLNLARIWPEMKAAEEMSPRNLNRLKRLLSKTAEYSPRNHLGSKWRQYHGCNDWVGLLDPFDENLRREVVRYGEFVQAAYHAFHSDPAMSAAEPPLSKRHVALPDKSYKVTKNLYATSSVGLPDWVDNLAPNLDWMTQRSSWVGYVAVCDNQNEIERMGRRDIVIALRGTSTCLEWAENVRTNLVNMSKPDYNSTETNPKVEQGFLSLFKTRGAHVPSLAESIVDEIQRLIETYKGETLSITVTGHSLGAALALLVADEVSTRVPNVPPVAVFSFGGPRVGNRDFANQIKNQNVKVLRVVNNQDLITKVPGMLTTTPSTRNTNTTGTGTCTSNTSTTTTTRGTSTTDIGTIGISTTDTGNTNITSTSNINTSNTSTNDISNTSFISTSNTNTNTTNNDNESYENTNEGSSTISRMLNVLDKNNPWAYSHVGVELRVDSKTSPYLKPNADVACCHDLEAYLHLVDGFMASNCPFRENAKRSLWKLVNEQRSNVKKLYTNKAKGLSLKPERNWVTMSSCLPSPSS